MSIRSQSPPMTYQDLLRLPEDHLRHELIGGEHFVSPSPAVKHQRIVLNLARILSSFARAHRLGEAMVGPLDVLLTEHDVVEPDVLFVSAARANRVQERYVDGAPDLVVEVLSPSNRKLDRTKKHRLYETHGVPEYWIVDPEVESVEVYRAATPGGPLALAGSLAPAAGDTLETPLLPGLRIPMSEVFE